MVIVQLWSLISRLQNSLLLYKIVKILLSTRGSLIFYTQDIDPTISCHSSAPRFSLNEIVDEVVSRRVTNDSLPTKVLEKSEAYIQGGEKITPQRSGRTKKILK